MVLETVAEIFAVLGASGAMIMYIERRITKDVCKIESHLASVSKTLLTHHDDMALRHLELNSRIKAIEDELKELKRLRDIEEKLKKIAGGENHG